MIRNLIEFIKGVISKMFNRQILQKVQTKEQVAISNDMVDAIDTWERMLEGKAPWIDADKGIHSSKMEEAICTEFANISISEMETKVAGNDKLNEYYQKAIKNLNENFQDCLGLGQGIIKPLGIDNEGKCEFIKASDIVPLEFNADGRLTQAVFIQRKTINDKTIYYRCEMHQVKDGKLVITNKAFKGTNEAVGDEIPLMLIDEWKDLPEEVSYDVDAIDFGYYKNPLVNRIDGSPNGVSIFERAKEWIKKLDIQNSRVDWEYESGERMVFADATTLEPITDSDGVVVDHKAPEGKERLIVGLDIQQDKQAPDTYSPAFRDENLINGVNEYKRNIEFAVGLAYGDLSKKESVEKTATEIKTSKQRKYQMVNAIQSNLKDMLEDLVKAIAFYNGMYNTNYEFVCNFKDSILTDEETEREQDRRDMQNGIMTRLEYRMKWYGEDEETAKKNLPVIELGATE